MFLFWHTAGGGENLLEFVVKHAGYKSIFQWKMEVQQSCN